ncbi:hypothetical protein CASFOL_005590 [Castilleja foliolosa]|uniref:Uncharacterized protein n=1 Tax=Castilleja foliolosa TaxID=1961234 RepID=A0ABD3E529_9LAMI
MGSGSRAEMTVEYGFICVEAAGKRRARGSDGGFRRWDYRIWGKSVEALRRVAGQFAQLKLTNFDKNQSKKSKYDFIALLAYHEPDKSPMFHLVAQNIDRTLQIV